MLASIWTWDDIDVTPSGLMRFRSRLPGAEVEIDESGFGWEARVTPVAWGAGTAASSYSYHRSFDEAVARAIELARDLSASPGR